MRKMSMDQLRSALKKSEESSKTNFQSNYYPYYNLKVGESAKIRFLPDLNENNMFGFYIEKYNHPLVIEGEKKVVPCLTMYKDPCPICELSSKLYKAGDKTEGVKYWKRLSRIAQVLIVEDPLPVDEETGENYTGKVKLLNIGFQLFNVIREGLGSEEFDVVPFAFEGGTDFILKKTEGQGGYASYTVGTKFARKPSDIDPELYLDQMIELHTALPNKPDLKEVQRLLMAAKSGVSLDDVDVDDEGDGDDFEAPKTTRQAPAKKAKVSKKVELEEDEDEVENETDDTEDLDDEEEVILQQIRARRQAK